MKIRKFIKRIKAALKKQFARVTAYIRRLLFPLYLFPIKLLTYSAYYLIKFFAELLIAFIGLILDSLVYPFRNAKNFLKSILIIAVSTYLLISIFVIRDYLNKQYGWWGKYLCSLGSGEYLQKRVVRIVGGYSEGSGFFISPNQVMTNFHVIADEPSPKIIFPDGKFITPKKIVGNKEVDLAVLFTEKDYNNRILLRPDTPGIYENEPLIAVGYPLGTELTGDATLLKGRFIDFRKSKKMPIGYLQTDISLVEGMSGGPLVDQCGRVVGINKIGLAGLSLFIDSLWAMSLVPDFTDQNISKINVDPSLSPEEAVKAFYTYLKARRMQDGFNLLSREYLKMTNFTEWTNRFTDILDVDVIKSEREKYSANSVFVKFATKNWVDNEVEEHNYEGTWQTVKEDGVYKMQSSYILEVENPEWRWYYE